MSWKPTRFESLLEAVPDALVGMDQEGVIRFVNQQTELLFGYDRDELIGAPVDRLLPEPLWQIYAEHQKNYFADPITRSSGLDVVLSGLHKDGTELPVNISLSHIDTGDVLLVVTAVRDVTEQHHAVQTAQLTAAVVEYSNDAIVGSTLKGTVTTWNPAAERLYGYSGNEIIGKSGSLLTPQGREGEFFANLASVMDGKAVERLETLRMRKDGTVVPVSVTVAPIRDEDGVVVGASAVHRDETEQKQAFEAFQRIAAIVEGSDEAIIGRTLEGIVTSWNPAAERMFGYSGAEMIGQPVDRLIPLDRRAEIATVVARVRAGQSVERVETLRVRKDGTVFPVSFTFSPIRDGYGEIVGASVMGRDLTEREQAARYARTLIEASLDPMVTVSPVGRIDDVNEATVKLTGVPRESLIGSDYVQYLTDPDKARAFFEEVFAQGTLRDFPLTVRHTTGTLTDILCNASVYRDLGGGVLGVFAAAHDVSRQRQALETAQRMAAIIEGSDDTIIGGSLDGIITCWNPAAVRMYGYSAEEIVGESVNLLIPEDRRGEVAQILAKVEAGQPVRRLETVRVRKDGTAIPVSLTISPIRNADGEVVGTSAIHHDITGRSREGSPT